jgi:diphthine-ammonia ligase
MTRAFVSWSGGKDCCLACYRAQQQGLEVCSLFNMAREDGARSRSHGFSTELLNMQARAMGLPLVQGQATWDDYEAEFERVLATLREKGITDGVYGDIDLDAHRQWVERVSRNCDITPHLPLWGQNQDDLMREFIDAGFRAIVVVVKADIMGPEWLGRELDGSFIADLAAAGGITPCGEAGEFHSLVIDGPLFSRGLIVEQVQKVRREGHWFLDIQQTSLSSGETEAALK